TAPTISAQRDTAANANGWNNADVASSYAASDALSGLPLGTDSGSFTFTAEGASQSHTFTVTDLAGNSASAAVSDVNIDTTAPPTRPQPPPPPNPKGWKNAEAPRGPAARAPPPGLPLGTDSGSFPFTAEGASQAHTFTVTDLAGNSASATVSDVNIDKTAPVTA